MGPGIRGTAAHALTGHTAVLAVAVTADGRRAVSGGWDKTVRVWDLESGHAAHALTGHDSRVVAVAVTRRRPPRGLRRRGRDGAGVGPGDGHSGAHPDRPQRPGARGGGQRDGRRAVSGGHDGMVRVWDLEAGTALHTLAGHDGAVHAVAASGDGRRAVSGGVDRTVRVWDLEAGTAQKSASPCIRQRDRGPSPSHSRACV